MSRETESKSIYGVELFAVHQPVMLTDGGTMCVWTWDERVQAGKADDVARRGRVDSQAPLAPPPPCFLNNGPRIELPQLTDNKSNLAHLQGK